MASRSTALAVLFLAACGSAFGKTADYALTEFTGVSLQLPLYAQVNVTTGSSYSATINATDDLVNNASVAVSNGVLVIGLQPNASVNTNFSSPQTISVLVPAQSLSAIALASSSGIVVDGAAINSQSKLSTSASGTGTLVVSNATSPGVSSQATGQGQTVVTGNIGAIGYTASGQGSAYFAGNVTSAMVDLTGQGNIYISSAASPTITGSSVGQSAVIYDQGACNVSAVGTTACVQQKNITMPGPVTAPTSGSISISNANSASSGSSSSGGSFSSSSSSSTGNGDSQSSTVFGPGSVSSSSSSSTG